MFMEMHILQHFAPANLNRDDTGMPKDCEFGGYRRARISSQCIKRAIRQEWKAQALLPPEYLAVRTKRLLGELADRLKKRGKSDPEATAVARLLLGGLGLAPSSSLVFLGLSEIEHLVDMLLEAWDELIPLADVENEPAGSDSDEEDSSARDRKKQAKAKLPSDIRKQADVVLDVALFGRMLADLPEHNVNAACQVAHAISTNRVTMEFDYFTAVDDLLPDETTGADMIGTVEFNSACYYRYANVDIPQLVSNLDGDNELTDAALREFIRASVTAVPTGKQNSFAAQNPPSLVFAVLRQHGLWSLANAFVDPASPTGGLDLVGASVRKLDQFWDRLAAMYGTQGIVGGWVTTSEASHLQALTREPCQVATTINELINGVLSAMTAIRVV